MVNLLMVFVGGGLGSAARYGAGLLVAPPTHEGFPWATFGVNLAGSFLIGLLGPPLSGHDPSLATWRALLVLGFCGGFTTFSTFAVQGFQQLQGGSSGTFLAYAAASVVGCVALAAGGWYLGRMLVPAG